MTKYPRILVCGGRDFNDFRKLSVILDDLCHDRGWDSGGDEEIWMPVVHVISGGARGADSLAIDWAVSNFLSFDVYNADWKTHGKAAGPIRNQKMLDEGMPDLVVAFPGGKGTADMVFRAKKKGVEVIEVH